MAIQDFHNSNFSFDTLDSQYSNFYLFRQKICWELNTIGVAAAVVITFAIVDHLDPSLLQPDSITLAKVPIHRITVQDNIGHYSLSGTITTDYSIKSNLGQEVEQYY